MKLILLIALLFSATQISFSQTAPSNKQIKKAVKAVKKGECILIYYTEMLASKFEKKQIEHVKVLFELDSKKLNDLFFKETNVQLRVTLFYILCTKYRSEISEKHFDALKGNQQITLCSGQNTESASLDEVVAYFYENSVPRKEKILNPKAQILVEEAQNLWYAGPVDFEKMISLLNAADSLEPNNPIILDARGDALFNSQIDVDGGLADFQNAITHSQDEKSLLIRYHNRGISFMSMGDIDKACEDWQKAGKMGEDYVNQHCNQPFDRVIHENPDSNLVLQFTLRQDSAFISSSHNSPMMSGCYAELKISSHSKTDVTITNGNLNLALENMGEALYLEAISEDGQKFRFFTETEFEFYDGEKDLIITPEKSYTTDLDITAIHHFPRPGKYKIRIAMRPTGDIAGFSQTYYSNWQELVVVKNYQKPE